MPVLRTAAGIDLFFDLSGPPDAPVVAFSNSLGCQLEMWDAQVAALSDRYRILRYDTRGHGRSKSYDRETSMDELGDDLAGLMDGLHIPAAHVVGLSMGGRVGQSMGVRHPQKVLSLCLMATGAHFPYPDIWDDRIRTVREQGMEALADSTMQRWFTPAGLKRRAAEVADMRARFARLDPAGYAVSCKALKDIPTIEDIRAIRAPTLVIAGALDPATPVVRSQEIVERIPGAELVVLPEAAHMIAVEQPEMVTRHLAAWLDAQSGAKPRAGGASFEAGLANRKSVLGADYVEGALAKAGSFGAPFQDFITRYAWGEIWGDDALPRKTRSIVVLATCIALGKEEEFKLHLRPALKNGVSLAELRALMIQSAVYAGVPAANGAFRWTRETLGAELDG
jgi:3-oxoadipate enol-lactonase/4-carboxymuconolactone decarboxylase